MAMSTRSKLFKTLLSLRAQAEKGITTKNQDRINTLVAELLITTSEKELDRFYKQQRSEDEQSMGRNARWGRAASQAEQGLQELIDLQGEFQDWLDNLPENLQSSALGDKLTEVTGLDLESAYDTVQEAANVDLPLGFGRD